MNFFALGLFLFIMADAAMAGEWLDCKRKQARTPNEKVDCSQYEKDPVKQKTSTSTEKPLTTKAPR